MLTKRKLIEIMPHNPDPDRWIEILDNVIFDTNAVTIPRAAALLAQLGHESGDCRWLEELGDGAAYEKRKDLGNTERGDGMRYKGRGIIQLTGRVNYRTAGSALGIDLEKFPQLAKEPATAGRVASWYWNTHGCAALADRFDFDGVTRAINGGLNGIQDRRNRFLRALYVLARLDGK